MARTVDDVHGFHIGLQHARSRIIRGVKSYNNIQYQEQYIRPLTPENGQLIEKFLLKLRREELAIGTILSHVDTSTRFAQELYEIGYTESILDIDQDTFDMFLLSLDDKDIAQGTVQNYKKTLRKFFNVMSEEPPAWIMKLKLRNVESPVQPSDIITKEELDIVMATCKNSRDRAIIAVLADGGLRVGALTSCRIKNVEFGKYGATIYLSKTSKSNKTTPAKGIPLTWSTGYLTRWLADHPLKDDPDAPLWVNLQENTNPMWYRAVRENLKNIAERAGIKKRLNPHSLRHFAVTNWLLDGCTEQEIKHRAGWTRGSSRMFDVYANFTDKEINDGIYEKYGLKVENKRETFLTVCPRCNNALRPGDKFCSVCALCLDRNALSSIEAGENITMEVRSILEKFGLWEELNRLQQKGESRSKD